MAALRLGMPLPKTAFSAGILPRWPLHAAVASFSGGESDCGPRQLVLYSKPGCCLCDGLKEKLEDALSIGGPHSLQSVRDISGNAEWERLYQYEIPVLAKVLPDGSEICC
ncbi:hypothetical protein AXF42_Ash017536 [Apostasia shenzhenica]|uniref:Glutaredoxin-like protein n=1 Tax=Apostasia shenzhenica TaxID=1088818 RepID=A0A2I0A374_9ASPA|nr:hypothetical protein AXF42_Ash017536 [Apostasia shenzhenica]